MKATDHLRALTDRRNSLAYWYPKIEGLVRTPETIIVEIDPAVYFKAMMESNRVPEADLLYGEQYHNFPCWTK